MERNDSATQDEALDAIEQFNKDSDDDEYSLLTPDSSPTHYSTDEYSNPDYSWYLAGQGPIDSTTAAALQHQGFIGAHSSAPGSPQDSGVFSSSPYSSPTTSPGPIASPVEHHPFNQMVGVGYSPYAIHQGGAAGAGPVVSNAAIPLPTISSAPPHPSHPPPPADSAMIYSTSVVSFQHQVIQQHHSHNSGCYPALWDQAHHHQQQQHSPPLPPCCSSQFTLPPSSSPSLPPQTIATMAGGGGMMDMEPHHHQLERSDSIPIIKMQQTVIDYYPPTPESPENRHVYCANDLPQQPYGAASIVPPYLPVPTQRSGSPKGLRRITKRTPKIKQPVEVDDQDIQDIPASAQLWEFTLKVLERPRYHYMVNWDNKREGLFRFHDAQAFAALWGKHRNRPNMTYDKVARALRYYYKRDILSQVGGRLTYRFSNRLQKLFRDN